MLVVTHCKEQVILGGEVSLDHPTNLSMQPRFFLEVSQMEVVCLQVLSKQQQGILEHHQLVDVLVQCHLDTWMQRHRTLLVQEVLVELDVEE
eukprot:s101_g44.t1